MKPNGVGVSLIKEFYTYVLFRPDGTAFYVGKGKGPRYMQCGNNQHAQNVYRQIEAAGEKVGVWIIPAETEAAAFAEEVRLIALYGRLDLGTGTLCNLTEGGEGTSGYCHTVEARAKLSRATSLFNSNLTEEQRKESTRVAREGITPEIRKTMPEKTREAILKQTIEQRRERTRMAREISLKKRKLDTFTLDTLPKPLKKESE